MSIPHALLALLAEESRFGLQLKDAFELRTGTVWPLNVGQVYSTLQRLERDEFVTTDGVPAASPGTKRYAITPAGRVELDTWLTTPPTTSAPPRHEVVIKVMVALTVPDVDVSAIIQVHRRQTLQAMRHFTAMKADSAQDLALVLVVDAELFRLEATTRWLDTCEARLSSGVRLRPVDSPAPAPVVSASARASAVTQ
jgi:DNA-binding PadR family transcriptional regulator